MPAVYQRLATVLPKNFTSYLGCVGEEACFHPNRPRTVSEITDGRLNTLVVIEIPQEQAIHWMSPLDASEEALLNLISQSTLAHADGFQGVFADGSVNYFSSAISPEMLRALMTAAGETASENSKHLHRDQVADARHFLSWMAPDFPPAPAFPPRR